MVEDESCDKQIILRLKIFFLKNCLNYNFIN